MTDRCPPVCNCPEGVHSASQVEELDAQPAATELQALLGVPEGAKGVQLPPE